jgi:DNA-binding NarL/FixJ family response regulator
MNMEKTSVQLALVDDHVLFRKGLRSLIDMVNPHHEVLFEADNGLDLQEKLKDHPAPQIILLDVNMPKMDGFETVSWLREAHPDTDVLVVSMIEREEAILEMVKLGVRGYLSKDVEPAELNAAINTIAGGGFYYTDFITGKLVHSLQHHQDNDKKYLSDREIEFIKLACSEMTYYEIADAMSLSPKTIDGYRSNLFEKLKVKSRVGLAMYAVKHELVAL